MCIRLLLVGLVFSLPANSFSQYFSTKWITQGTSWIRIRTINHGLVRLSAAELVGLPGNVRPEHLHLFFRGLEQPIYIKKVNDSPFFSGDDYIEFVCQKNDGVLEAQLYRNPNTGRPEPELAPTVEVSQFDDSAAYFLTWNDQKRLPAFSYRSTTSQPDTAASPVSWYIHKVRKDFDVHNGIYLTGGGTTYDPFLEMNSDYVTGEGYLDRPFNSTITHTLDVPGVEVQVPMTALVIVRIVGRNYIQHRIRISVGSVSEEFTYPNITYRTCSLRVPLADLANGRIQIAFTAMGGNASSTDVNAVCWIECQYPRSFSFAEPFTSQVLQWDSQSDSKETISVRLAWSEEAIIAYDPIELTRQECFPLQNGTFTVSVEGRPSFRQLVVIPQSTVNSALIDVSNFSPQHELLEPLPIQLIVITHRKLARSAQAYLDYRQKEAPNLVKGKLVFVEDLYEHFSYGSSHPLAIKEYLRRHLQLSSPMLRYVTFWGQGRYAKTWGKAHVPTWGYPASDKEFVSRFDEPCQDDTPLAAIGRVNVLNDEQGLAYLGKLMEYEGLPHQPWMQRIIHAGGGSDLGEQTSIERFLIQNDSLVSAVGFQSFRYQNRVRPIPSDPVLPDRDQLMRQGALFVQVFGHTNHNATDVQLREPEWYNNPGRYYVMLMNGCYSSDFANSPALGTLGERFIRKRDAGAVAFLASSGVGYVQSMGSFTSRFYELAFRDSIHLSLGELVKRTIESYTTQGAISGPIMRNQIRQFHLQGCPLAVMQTPTLPDLSFAPRSINLNPTVPSLEDTILTFDLAVRNTGRFTSDRIELVVDYWSELSGVPAITILQTSIDPINKADTIQLTLSLPTFFTKAGLNRLTFRINPEQSIKELNYDNNTWIFEWVLPGREPLIAYPPRYAVVGSSHTELVSILPGKPHNEITTCWFELDTVPNFSSPFCQKSGPLNLPSGRMKWMPKVTWADSQIYFWRIRTANMPDDSWSKSSFQWINHRAGWGQSHPAQLAELETEGVVFTSPPPTWHGAEEFHEMTVGVWPNRLSISQNQQRASDAMDQRIWMTTLFLSVVDRQRLQVLTSDSIFGLVKPIDVFNDSTTLKSLVDTLNKNQLVILLCKIPQFERWLPINLEQLNRIGASSRIDSIRRSGDYCTGFILIGQRGLSPGSANERFIFGPSNGVTIDSTLTIRRSQGTVRTLRIGPASKWSTLSARIDSTENRATQQIKLMGHRFGGQVDSLGSWSVNKLFTELNFLSPGTYPMLQLAWQVGGSSGTPLPQLFQWHVLYDIPPDYALATQDTLVSTLKYRAGRLIKIPATAWLIFGSPADSVPVRFSIFDEIGELVRSDEYWIKNLSDVLPLYLQIKAPPLAGLYRLVGEINPGQHFSESFTFNNRVEWALNIISVEDTTIPRLQVYLNGLQARQGMRTTPAPDFLIKLSDDPTDAPLDRSSDCLISFRWQHPETKVWTDYLATDLNGRVSFTFEIDSERINQATWRIILSDLRIGFWELVIRPNGPTNKPWIHDVYRLQFEVIENKPCGVWTLTPNPASKIILLTSPAYSVRKPVSIVLELADPIARTVFQTSEISMQWNPHTSQVSISLEPQQTSGWPIQSGIYYWRIRSKYSDQQVEFSQYGKLIWVKP
jgi:hypothetical protein